MLSIAICDDDLNFLNIFTNIVYKTFSDMGQQVEVTKFCDGQSLMDKVKRDRQFFDVIFLDVEMPVTNGFQVAQKLRELNSAFILIFTTYIEHQSREGYRYGAFRYVFKNNLKTELNEAVSCLINKIEASAADHKEIIFKCKTAGVYENLTINQGNILYLKREKNRCIILKTVCSEYELLKKPLTQYYELLKPPTFNPIMRNYIVNFNHVKRIDTDCFILTGNVSVPLGVKREVKKASLEKYHRFLEELI